MDCLEYKWCCWRGQEMGRFSWILHILPVLGDTTTIAGDEESTTVASTSIITTTLCWLELWGHILLHTVFLVWPWPLLWMISSLSLQCQGNITVFYKTLFMAQPPQCMLLLHWLWLFSSLSLEFFVQSHSFSFGFILSSL